MKKASIKTRKNILYMQNGQYEITADYHVNRQINIKNGINKAFQSR